MIICNQYVYFLLFTPFSFHFLLHLFGVNLQKVVTLRSNKLQKVAESPYIYLQKVVLC